jgi:hypothetical protein
MTGVVERDRHRPGERHERDEGGDDDRVVVEDVEVRVARLDQEWGPEGDGQGDRRQQTVGPASRQPRARDDPEGRRDDPTEEE